MEKFQNFLNSLYSKTKNFGGTALEKLNQFGEYLAPSDLKIKNTVFKIYFTPKFITKDGGLDHYFQAGVTTKKKETDLGEDFEDESKVEDEERNYLKRIKSYYKR